MEARGCSSEGEHAGYHKHLAIFFFGSDEQGQISVPHSGLAKITGVGTTTVVSAAVSALSGQDPAPTRGADRQLGCATKEVPVALFYMLK